MIILQLISNIKKTFRSIPLSFSYFVYSKLNPNRYPDLDTCYDKISTSYHPKNKHTIKFKTNINPLMMVTTFLCNQSETFFVHWSNFLKNILILFRFFSSTVTKILKIFYLSHFVYSAPIFLDLCEIYSVQPK